MQTTHSVFMVRPVCFSRNHQTATSNSFQRYGDYGSQDDIQRQALAGFDGFVNALKDNGIRVYVFEDNGQHYTPDSIFPNNWITLHPDGKAILYPMEAPNRRKERDRRLIQALSNEFTVTEIIDLSAYEREGCYLEGTGSLVCDHRQRIAYLCRSSRSTVRVMDNWQSITGYQAHWFDAYDEAGNRIYHTNVMMSIGIKYAVVCLDALTSPKERTRLEASLTDSGKTLIPITLSQMASFCGNILELSGIDGQPVIAMSQRAWNAFDAHQQAVFTDYASIAFAPIDIIEELGGGGARCMLAEIFSPPVRATVTPWQIIT